MEFMVKSAGLGKAIYLNLCFYPPQTYTDVIGNFTSVELSNSGDYVWTCSAGLELPSSNGSYNYEVRFGEILPVWRPAFTVRIREFRGLQKHVCLRHILFGAKIGFKENSFKTTLIIIIFFNLARKYISFNLSKFKINFISEKNISF